MRRLHVHDASAIESGICSVQTTPSRLRSCTLKTAQQSRWILPKRTPLGRYYMAAGSSKAGTWPAPMTPGRLKPANAIALNRAASLIDTVNVEEEERVLDSTSRRRYVPKWIVSVSIGTATL